MQLEVVNYIEHHILAKVVEEDGFKWYLTGFYGWPEASQKLISWALLSHLSTLVEGPWCCIGDFNAILLSSEKQSKHPQPYKEMEEFGLGLDSCRLADMGFRGCPFTWNNKRPGEANTKERLDRVVANLGWRERFPTSTITHLFSYASDHSPLLLHTMIDHGLRGKGVNGFKFNEAWLLWDDCERMVADSWVVGQKRVGSAMSNIKDKIESCGSDLHAWGSSKTRPDVDEIKILQTLMENINKCEPFEESRVEFLEASKSLNALLLKKKIFWHQHS